MTAPITLYVNPAMVEANLSYSPLLFPFWKPKIKKSTPFASAIWKQYAFDQRYLQLADSPEQADFIFLAHNYWAIKQKNPELVSAVIRDAEKLRKPVLIDAYGDSDDIIPIKHACILRTSQYRFKYQPNEVILPAYVEDVLERYCDGALNLRSKQATPVVGFVGWADSSFADALHKHLKGSLFRFLALFEKKYAACIPGVLFRKYALTRLQRASQVKANFIIRATYSGHKSTIQGDMQEVRQQFVTNMLESDYTLNIKGNGNYSQRFYETLSVGRIPIFVDTECVLPLESVINYKEFCVFVDHSRLSRIAETVSGFHRHVEPERFVWMQQRAREVFEKYLRVDSLTSHLANVLHHMAQTLAY